MPVFFSTHDQDTAVQMAALKSAGCKIIFQEKGSGGRWDRPELHRLLGQLRKGDTVVVWKLDRLSRSLKDLLSLMEKIQNLGAGFKSLTESIDTTSSAGRMMMQIVGSFAEFERAMLRERTCNGLHAARKEGRIGGRRTNLRQINNKKLSIWSVVVKRPQPMLQGCLMCIRQQYRDCFVKNKTEHAVARLDFKLLKRIFCSTASRTHLLGRFPRPLSSSGDFSMSLLTVSHDLEN